MKKSLFLIAAFIAFASAQGAYFDVGFGWGEAKTKIGNKNYFKEANTLLANNAEEDALEANFKIGYGPFSLGIGSLYVVADLGVFEHNIFNNLNIDNDVTFNTYVFGPGVILYPISSIQIGLSAGVSVATVEMTTENIEFDSDLGYMYSLSAAFDVGASLEVLKELFGNHGFLIGAKYSGARNPTYVSGKAIKTEMSSFFIKYVYIHRKKRLNQDFQD